MKNRPTPEFIAECFDYNPETGVVTWKDRPRAHFSCDDYWKAFNARHSGRVAGCKDSNSDYRVIKMFGRHHFEHRVVWVLLTGAWPTKMVDHRNGVPGDNRAINLREASLCENARNAKKSCRNTSGVKGVSWDRRKGKWRARLRVGKKPVLDKRVNDLAEAERIIKKAREELHRDFTNHG